MMLIEQSSVPVGSLPLAEFRDHLRLGTGFADDGVQDGLLESTLRAALSAVEIRTGKALIARDFLWRLTGWRDREGQALPVAPVSAILSLRLIDRVGDATVIDAGAYRLQMDDQRPRLMPTGSYLPAVPVAGEAEVTFTAGFGAAWSDMPADIAQAVFLLGAHYYENRHGSSDMPMPDAVSGLISRYRTVRVLGGRG